jgi:hypothetical protein
MAETLRDSLCLRSACSVRATQALCRPLEGRPHRPRCAAESDDGNVEQGAGFFSAFSSLWPASAAQPPAAPSQDAFIRRAKRAVEKCRFADVISASKFSRPGPLSHLLRALVTGACTLRASAQRHSR